jgi:hypothetical protein
MTVLWTSDDSDSLKDCFFFPDSSGSEYSDSAALEPDAPLFDDSGSGSPVAEAPSPGDSHAHLFITDSDPAGEVAERGADLGSDAGAPAPEEEELAAAAPPRLSDTEENRLTEGDESSIMSTTQIPASSGEESESMAERAAAAAPGGPPPPRSPSLSERLADSEFAESPAYDSGSEPPQGPALPPEQRMEDAARLFAASPLKALKMAAAARGRKHSITESVAILTASEQFDPAQVTRFLVLSRNGPILRRVFDTLSVPADFVATLRRSLGGTPFWVPDDPDDLERVLEIIVDVFAARNPGVFQATADGVVVAFALLMAAGQPAVANPGVAKRLRALTEREPPTELDILDLLGVVAGQLFPRQPAHPAPRFHSRGRMRAGKGSEKGTPTFLVMDSLCLFFFKEDPQFDTPDHALQLVGCELEHDQKDLLRIVITSSKALAFAKYDGAKAKAVAGVKRVEIILENLDLVKKWMLKLKRALVVGMFAPARGPLAIPACERPRSGGDSPVQPK